MLQLYELPPILTLERSPEWGGHCHWLEYAYLAIYVPERVWFSKPSLKEMVVINVRNAHQHTKIEGVHPGDVFWQSDTTAEDWTSKSQMDQILLFFSFDISQLGEIRCCHVRTAQEVRTRC